MPYLNRFRLAFLKNKYNIYKVKSTRSSAVMRIPAGQDNAIQMCFNTLVVLCDRIMKTNINQCDKLLHYPMLADFFANESQKEFPDFAIAHASEIIIQDQSRVFDWKPIHARVATLTGQESEGDEEKKRKEEERKHKREELEKESKGKEEEAAKKRNKMKKVKKEVKKAVQKQILTMETTKVEQYNPGICISLNLTLYLTMMMIKTMKTMTMMMMLVTANYPALQSHRKSAGAAH